MADFQAGLYSFLTGNSTVTDQVGTRIYPRRAPATASLPYLVYQRLGRRAVGHLTGLTEIVEASYQLTIWGSTDDEVEAARLAIQPEIDGYMGLMGSVDVRRVIVESVLDTEDEPEEGLTTGTPGVAITATFWYRDT